jgi:hypothetical protein
LTSTISKAQTSRFEQYNLKYGISIEIPNHWKIIDKQIMDQIDSNTESLTQVPQGDNDIIIAANYIVSDQILATIRISVRTRNTFTQDTIKNMSQSEIDKQDVFSRNILVNGLAQMNDTLTRVSEFKTTKEMLAGLVCLNTNYQTIDSSKNMNTFIYVFYLGSRAVKMTLSYENNRVNLLKPTIERIRKSLTIRK